MLLEELLALPVGTRVIGDIETVATLPGIVESRGDGSRLIRWADGYITVPFGNVRDADEYIAAHTRLAVRNRERILCEADRQAEIADQDIRSKSAA